MPKTKIPVYFFKEEENSTIKCQYVAPVELYKIWHYEDSIYNEQLRLQFIGIDNIDEPHTIGINLEVIEDLHKQYISQSQQISQPDSKETNTINSEGEKIYTIQPINYNDLLDDNSKTLYRCIDIYGNIVEVFIPNDKINDKKYWITQAQQYKLLCDSDYLPFHYSSEDTELEEVAEEIGEIIFGEVTAYCFYDTEMEGEYYKCYGIKFPLEEKEDLETIKEQSLKVVENEFPKVKIYYEDQIEKQLKSNYFFHETSFKIGDTEIDLTPSKEEMYKSKSSPEYGVARGYLPNEKNPETEVIALIDSNKIKNYSVATDKEFVARITINRKTSDDNSYGKVTEVQFGKNKKADRPYTAAEARKLLLVNCARKNKNLAKNTEESFLDLVLSKPDYYTSEDCPVRLLDCHKLITGDWSKEKLEKEVESCTKNFSSNGNIIIPMVKKYPDSTSHMFVIVANKNGSETRFKIFDPSITLELENEENIEQDLGDYIYDNLEKGNYILSPKERIQNTLAEHNPIFDPTCTGVSVEYINYMLENEEYRKNPQQLTEEEGKKIQISYAQNVIGNGLHHMILGEQQIDTSTLYDHILLHDDERLKLVKYSDYKKDFKKYKASDVVCAINGQEIIITSDKDKFNNDIPGIKRKVYEDKAEHYKVDYVEFPVYVNNKRLELSIFADGETYLYDESLEYSPSVDLIGFNIKLFLDAVSNNNLENNSNTPNDRILLYNNERLKLVKCSDYEKKLKNDKEYHVVRTTDGENFIIPSDQGEFNTNIPGIKRVTNKDEDSVYIPVNMNNEKFELLITRNGEIYLTSEKKDFPGIYRPVYLTGFDTSPLFNATSNSIPENSSNKSSETVTRSEDMEPIIDIRPEDMEQEDIEKECRGFEANKQAQNTLQEKTTTVETKAFQETRQVKQDEVVDKKEVKPEAVSVAVNGADKKPIQEEITVRNAPVETPKEYPIETKFVDDELNIDLIKHKEEEQKKKEEEQKKKETGSIIPALQDVNKVQTHKENKEESGTFNLLSDRLRNKEKDNKEQKPSSKEDNKDQEQETIKDSGLIKRKGRYK